MRKMNDSIFSLSHKLGVKNGLNYDWQINDFRLELKISKNKNKLVPLAISSFKNIANDSIQFELIVKDFPIDSYIFQIVSGKKVIYTFISGRNGFPRGLSVGKHIIKWNGFDHKGVFNSEYLKQNTFRAKVIARKEVLVKEIISHKFRFGYSEVDWVDTIISLPKKQIDITLRVNLIDGGESGTQKDCRTTGSGSYSQNIQHCPWDKIPNNVLNQKNKAPIKTRTQSFKDLSNLALEGIRYHWSRNNLHSLAKSLNINGKPFELTVTPINTKTNSMDDVELRYNTNNPPKRSGNPGTVEDPISFIGNLVSWEAIYYNVGYIKYPKAWFYALPNIENIVFKLTSAHEIGHTILKAFGGTIYSYGHKGSVNTITQNANKNAKPHPTSGEIDLMPYYTDSISVNNYNRYVASKKDTLGLIWLTKLEAKTV